MTLPEETRSLLLNGLERGYVLVMRRPDSPAAGKASNLVWWLVHPRTGETLGLGPFGGQALTEYVLIQGAATAFGMAVVFTACCGLNGGNTATPHAANMCGCVGFMGGMGIGLVAATSAAGAIALPFFVALAFGCVLVF